MFFFSQLKERYLRVNYKMGKLTEVLFLLAIGLVLVNGIKKKKVTSPAVANLVKMPNSVKGFNWDRLKALKEKIGEHRWVKLKHLFLLNPHLPVLLLTGQGISKDDIVNLPSWMVEDNEEVSESEPSKPEDEVPVSSTLVMK